MGEYTLARRDANLTVRFLRGVLAPIVGSRLQESWQGQHHIPATGGAVLCYNHLSVVDPLIAGRFVWLGGGRFPHFLGKSEIFAVPVLGRVLVGIGQIPVHRGSARAIDSYRSAVTAVQGGQAVVILPEGTLTRDPDLWPMKGKTGAARVALETGAPLIPMAIWGPQEIVPSHAAPWYRVAGRCLRRYQITAAAGLPVSLEDLREQPITASMLNEATERLMSDITMLLAQIRRQQPPNQRMENPRVISRQPRRPNWVAGHRTLPFCTSLLGATR